MVQDDLPGRLPRPNKASATAGDQPPEDAGSNAEKPTSHVRAGRFKLVSDRSDSPPPSNGGDRGPKVKLQPTALDAWKRFAYELHVALGALEEDEYLVVSIKGGNFFVQFAAQGAFGMRAEAVSNFYLPEEHSLVEGQHRALLDLGWHGPTKLPPEMRSGRHDPDGSPNYFLDAEAPVPHDELALIAVNTLRGVFGASHPGSLEYLAFANDKTSIRFPHLRIIERSKNR